jgi:hypothetical protein
MIGWPAVLRLQIRNILDGQITILIEDIFYQHEVADGCRRLLKRIIGGKLQKQLHSN